MAAVREAVRLHAERRSSLPEEAYLGWETSTGAAARSLALPGALWGEDPAIGIKIINSSLGNVARGIPRAHGIFVLFDRETARPIAIMEAAYISALRTAAYTALTVELLGSRTTSIAVIGCGTIGAQHIRLLAETVPEGSFLVYDSDESRSQELVTTLKHLPLRVAASAREAVEQADVVITTTTTTTGYLRFDWLRPGALIAHVSLDDVLPEVVEQADLVIVDDWTLVASDDRRLLGRMFRSGSLAPPPEAGGPAAPGRRVDATLGGVLVGSHPGRVNDDQIVLSNPFGMGILDVAIAAEVWRVASRLDLGVVLPN